LFLKDNLVAPAGTAIETVTTSVSPIMAGSGAQAAFGALKGDAVDVAHGLSAPVAAVVQPAGSAGGVTPSKF
jgi:hypothetical protein